MTDTSKFALQPQIATSPYVGIDISNFMAQNHPHISAISSNTLNPSSSSDNMPIQNLNLISGNSVVNNSNLIHSIDNNNVQSNSFPGISVSLMKNNDLTENVSQTVSTNNVSEV
jgi:hypothetical protein